MRDRDRLYIYTLTVILWLILFCSSCDCLNNKHIDQEQNIQTIIGSDLKSDTELVRDKRESVPTNKRIIEVNIYSKFSL